MKITKRFMLIIMALAVFSANISFAEQAAEPVQYKLPDEIAQTAYIGSVVYLNNALYLLIDQKDIYKLQKGEEYFSIYAKNEIKGNMDDSSVITDLYTDGEKLYGLNVQGGTFFEVGENNGELVRINAVELNYEQHKDTYENEDVEHSYNQHPQDTMLNGGKLFCIFRQSDDFTGNILTSFDIKTGEETTYSPENVVSMASYKDGKLMLVTQDTEKIMDSDDPKDSEPKLFVFDPDNDSMKEVGPLLIQDRREYFQSVIIYDETRDAVMYFKNSDLMLRNEDASATKCAHFPQSYLFVRNGGYALLPGNRIAVIIDGSLHVTSTDPADLPSKSLVVYNGNSQNHEYVLKKMTDTEIKGSGEDWYSSAQELGQALISGTKKIDIFQIDNSYIDTRSIIDKGYAMDITDVKGVKEFVDSLYPYIKEQCVKDGRIYALPVDNYYTAFSENPMVMESLNIKTPKTFADVCDILSDFYSDEDITAQYGFCEDFMHVKGFMWYMLFELYSNHMYLSGEDLTYDTPLFRSMAEKLMKALEKVPANLDSMPQGDVEEYYGKPFLFSSNGLDIYQMSYLKENERWLELTKENPLLAENDSYKNSDSYMYSYSPLALKADESSPDGFPVSLSLLFVNSKTEDPENAKRYVENFIDGYNCETKYRLSKDYREPKLSQYYDKSLENVDGDIENIKKQLEKAEGAEKTELEKHLAMSEVRKQLMLEGIGKYEFSQELIDDYKSYLDKVYVLDYDKNMYSSQEQIQSLKQRLQEGQMDIDMFIKEIDAKIKLMKLENQ